MARIFVVSILFFQVFIAGKPSIQDKTNNLKLDALIGIPDEVPYGESPETPGQKDLIEVSKTNEVDLNLVQGIAYLGEEIFEGWAFMIFHDNNHRYRYTKYESGKKVWQVGYYLNGVLDHDFHVLNGKNKGSQRMWREDGSPYIDNFFLEGGILHGIQKRWYSDYKLAMESEYDHGKLIYKKEYDEEGNLVGEW